MKGQTEFSAGPAAASLRARLVSALDELLPGAELEETVLPEWDAVRLLLLRDTQAGRGLEGEAAQRVMDNPLYWIFCWASGRVLARSILQRPERVRGRRVLDFGCGSGVVAIAAAMAGAAEVIACDLDPLARCATAHNAALNDQVVTLCEDFHHVQGHLDLILAADVLYDLSNMEWLATFRDRADDVWIADSRIRDFREPGFERVGTHESATLPDLGESLEFNRVSLYRSRSYC